MKAGVILARKTFSITMDEELIKKLDEVATSNHRRRGPEVNVAVEFYLKYHGIDLDKLKQPSVEDSKQKNDDDPIDIDMGDFDFDNDDN